MHSFRLAVILSPGSPRPRHPTESPHGFPHHPRHNNSNAADETPQHQPFVPPSQSPPEFTWPAVLAGAVLGIIFGASSLYLVLKVGLTVSASVPIAVLSITLFRAFSKAFKRPQGDHPRKQHRADDRLGRRVASRSASA